MVYGAYIPVWEEENTSHANMYKNARWWLICPLEVKEMRGQKEIRIGIDMGEVIIREYFGESDGTPLQYSCLENPMGGGAWWAAVHGVATSQTWLSNFTFTFHFYALEKETTTHSSVHAWRIPGMGSHGVGHDWSDLAVAVVKETSKVIDSTVTPRDPAFQAHTLVLFSSLELGTLLKEYRQKGNGRAHPQF